MFNKILATSLALALTLPLIFAQEMPGMSQDITTLQEKQTLSAIAVTASSEEAVFEFQTQPETHAVIEYGMTPEYEFSLTTEPQTAHSETIAGLTECTKYYYRVHTAEVDREGDFMTECPIVTKAPKVAPRPAPQKTPKTLPISDTSLALNAAPEAPQGENQSVIANTTENAVMPISEVEDEVTPELPNAALPIIDEVAVATPAPSSNIPLPLILFAVLSGLIVLVFAVKKRK